MIDVGGCLVILVILGIIYAIIVTIEEKLDDDYDDVLETKCKNCICYNICSRHGRDCNCKDYMTEEMLQKRGGHK